MVGAKALSVMVDLPGREMRRTLTERSRVPKPSAVHSTFSAGRAFASPGLQGSIVMTERKRLFRRVFESMIEGRARQAQRYITEYLKNRPVETEWRP
jgi:hypothetical protein